MNVSLEVTKIAAVLDVFNQYPGLLVVSVDNIVAKREKKGIVLLVLQEDK